MSGDESERAQPRQDVATDRDAYVGGRDTYVFHGDTHVVHQEPSASARSARIWGSVPARNAAFAGRKGLLSAVRRALAVGDPVAVQALHGRSGVGKTQIAIEYAHRHAADYDVVWWLNAENAALLGEQFAALAAELGCAARGAPLDVVQRAVLNELHQFPRWLLVFDNAEEPADVRAWLPGGAGHVLITSRASGWEEVAICLEVDVLARADSVTILKGRVSALSDSDADKLAAALDDIPLAVAQAASYLAETKMRAVQYIALLRNRAAELMGKGKLATYPGTLTAVTQFAYDRLRAEDEQAAVLAAMCAFLAPETVPEEWFVTAAEQLPVLMAARLSDPLARAQLLAGIDRSSLARLDPGGLLMHRLTQAILRDHLPADQAAAARRLAESVVAANDPGDTDLPGTWPTWARVLPHLLALEPETSSSASLRDVAGSAAWYLTRRGDAGAAHELAGNLYEGWRDGLGPDNSYTLWAANSLAQALRDMGRFAQAQDLDEDTLARRRRLIGEDHPHTFASANNLALDLRGLGEFGAARELDEDLLARRRRVLGEDHPETLVSASNLAVDLSELGEFEAARRLDEDTLARRRRALREDHPDTLVSASNLAVDLRTLGEFEAARKLDEDTLARRRRVLGEDHPDTLLSASNLARDLYELEQYRAALELDEDVLARRRLVLGRSHPNTQQSAHNLAEDLRMLEEPGGRPIE
jgi:tetratricopeptide (TPR) repeat protein